MHSSSWMISALEGPVASTPTISSVGMMRMHFSGQMSTQPPHRMQIEGSSMMFRKHWRHRDASCRASSGVYPSSTSGEPIRRSDGSAGIGTRGYSV